MTTHSHLCGLIHETIEEYELVLASGQVVSATRDNEHEMLWRALPWSHGTLGLLVGLRLRVVPASPWVRLTYHPCRSAEALRTKYAAILAQADADDPTCPFFVEAIVFSESESVLMTGVLGRPGEEGSEEVAELAYSAPANNIGFYSKPWFYKHVESKLDQDGCAPLFVLASASAAVPRGPAGSWGVFLVVRAGAIRRQSRSRSGTTSCDMTAQCA